jgi:hypothetical protein
MRKSILLITFLVVSTCIYSQHLKFSGIPIDGTISEFQNKLAAKGIKQNRTKSNEAPVGQRVFNGRFQGYNSEITVFYNRKSKQVYKVEAVIESKKKDVIQNILDKSIQTIEQKYIFQTAHEVSDGTDLHYQYIIYPTKESVESTGTIHVKPSYTFYIPNNAVASQGFQLASFIISFEYEDAVNTSSIKPSETEPLHSWQSSCGEPENHEKFLIWANNYRKHDCYDKCIYYMTWALDYYKYGCAPQSTSEYEEILDNAILVLKGRQIGRIKTAYSKEYANVYRVPNEDGQFKCIEFGVCSDMYQVKLYASDITRQIYALESLRKVYNEKKKSILGTQLSDYWKEDINLSMPALIGKDRLRGEFGDIEWKEYNLTMRFTQFKQELRVEVNFDDYKQIFLFCSEEEIGNYLAFLRSIQK